MIERLTDHQEFHDKLITAFKKHFTFSEPVCDIRIKEIDQYGRVFFNYSIPKLNVSESSISIHFRTYMCFIYISTLTQLMNEVDNEN